MGNIQSVAQLIVLDSGLGLTTNRPKYVYAKSDYDPGPNFPKWLSFKTGDTILVVDYDVKSNNCSTTCSLGRLLNGREGFYFEQHVQNEPLS